MDLSSYPTIYLHGYCIFFNTYTLIYIHKKKKKNHEVKETQSLGLVYLIFNETKI